MKKLVFVLAFSSIILLFNRLNSYCQHPEIDSLIEKGSVKALNEWLTEHDINGYYNSRQYSPLIYSIIFNRIDLVKRLISSGANLELKCESKSPLLFALEYNRTRIARYLIRTGANLNVRDTLMNTPLFYAAGQNNIALLRLLIRKGVPLEVKNVLKINVRTYAVLSNNQKAAKFLKNYFERHLPNYCDGPYVRLGIMNHLNVYYLQHDSIKSISSVKGITYKSKSDFFSFKGFVCDTITYTINRNPVPDKDSFPEAPAIYVMGDVHGDYKGMISLLKIGGIIDDHLNWSWGNGHLVFLGDIADRGDHVTECLWLIYKLEQQAGIAGGYVHYILGNHEIMILTKDYRYLADKYYYLNDRLKIDYSRHFDLKTVFGRWLRSKTCIIKIGPYLFLHAGLSFESVKNKYHIKDLNYSLRFYLTNPKSKYVNDTIRFIIGVNGPLWYRGYSEQYNGNYKITMSELDSLLAFYGVSSIFVGHTTLPSIKSLYHGKVICMDIPYYLDEAEPMALKIIKGKYYIIRDKMIESELDMH